MSIQGRGYTCDKKQFTEPRESNQSNHFIIISIHNRSTCASGYPFRTRSTHTTNLHSRLGSCKPTFDQLSDVSFPAPRYLNAQPNTFVIYLLSMCLPLTSVCYGCKSYLKPGGSIGSPPRDLVIVSNMTRTWTHDGQLQSRPGNVYFRCFPSCVQKRQPCYQPHHSFILSRIASLLCYEHWRFINQTFGNLAIC